MTAPRISVLLSTWNGERFLGEQIDSILTQRDVDVMLIVRDDGSTDTTRTILDGYAARGAPIDIRAGANVGAAASYFELLRTAPPADFHALVDQDDVWDADRLGHAAALLGKLDPTVPAVYCSRLRYIDAEGRPRGMSRLPRTIHLRNALAENVVIGCTIVMNGAARDLVNACRPDSVVMHDAWIYLAVSAFGRIVYDGQPRVAYRLHGANAIGARANPLADFTLHFRRLMRRRGFGFHQQAAAFLRCFGDRLDASQRAAVAAYATGRDTLLGRLRCAVRAPIVRQSRLHELLYRCLILLDLD
jgi:glycosyltransferase involved in cell wall biosynthesis